MADEMIWAKGTFKEIKEIKAQDSWVLFELKFINSKDEQEIIFNAFNSVGKNKGKKLDELIVDSVYKIGYTITQKEGKDLNNLKWVDLFVPKDFSKPLQTTSKKFDNSGEIKKVEFNKESLVYSDFVIEYVREMHKNHREPNSKHFIGCLIWAFNKELNLTELTDWLNNLYETKVKLEYELIDKEEIQMK